MVRQLFFKIHGISTATKMRLYRSLSVIRLPNLDTQCSGRKEAIYIGNGRIENHTGSAQIEQDTQRRNSKTSVMH